MMGQLKHAKSHHLRPKAKGGMAKKYMTWQPVQDIKDGHTKLTTYSHMMGQTGRLKH